MLAHGNPRDFQASTQRPCRGRQTKALGKKRINGSIRPAASAPKSVSAFGVSTHVRAEDHGVCLTSPCVIRRRSVERRANRAFCAAVSAIGILLGPRHPSTFCLLNTKQLRRMIALGRSPDVSEGSKAPVPARPPPYPLCGGSRSYVADTTPAARCRLRRDGQRRRRSGFPFAERQSERHRRRRNANCRKAGVAVIE